MPSLSDIRTSQGLTQTQLAEKAGVSFATVNRMETGKAVLKVSFYAVCQALRVNPEEIVGVVLHSGLDAAAKRKKRN